MAEEEKEKPAPRKTASKTAPKKDQPDMGAYDMRHVSRPIENDDPYDMTGLNEE